VIGTTIIKNNQRDRYAGGPRRTFERIEVVTFGLHARYGDSVTRYQVRLQDGTELMIKGPEQPADDLHWLRALAKRTPHPVTNRDCPQADTWIEVNLNVSVAGPVDSWNCLPGECHCEMRGMGCPERQL
jgi:hypothetical protein